MRLPRSFREIASFLAMMPPKTSRNDVRLFNSLRHCNESFLSHHPSLFAFALILPNPNLDKPEPNRENIVNLTMKLLTETFAKEISFTLGCYDRIIIKGTIPEICHCQGMTSFMLRNKLRIFDYAKYVEQYKETLRQNAEKIAAENSLVIEFVRKSSLRKEDIIQNKLQQRGGHCGLVHIISAMETCTTYKPWHDKTTGRTFLKYDITKCLHYYFYFIDDLLGLCYVKVPTYCPFPLQIYFNGHNWLAQQMKKTGIAFTTLDNAFDYIEYPAKAQALADTMDIKKIHEKLDEYAFKFCPASSNAIVLIGISA